MSLGLYLEPQLLVIKWDYWRREPQMVAKYELCKLLQMPNKNAQDFHIRMFHQKDMVDGSSLLHHSNQILVWFVDQISCR